MRDAYIIYSVRMCVCVCVYRYMLAWDLLMYSKTQLLRQIAVSLSRIGNCLLFRCLLLTNNLLLPFLNRIFVILLLLLVFFSICYLDKSQPHILQYMYNTLYRERYTWIQIWSLFLIYLSLSTSLISAHRTHHLLFCIFFPVNSVVVVVVIIVIKVFFFRKSKKVAIDQAYSIYEFSSSFTSFLHSFPFSCIGSCKVFVWSR